MTTKKMTSSNAWFLDGACWRLEKILEAAEECGEEFVSTAGTSICELTRCYLSSLTGTSFSDIYWLSN